MISRGIQSRLFFPKKRTVVIGGAGGSGWANRATIALIRLLGAGGSVTFIGGEEAATLFDRYSISAG